MDLTMAFGYSAFGVSIISEIELPELTASKQRRQAELEISLGRVIQPPPEAFSLDRAIISLPGGQIVAAWKEVGAFRMERGSRIVVQPDKGVQPNVLRLFLLGTCLAIALQQRSLAVFHASAIATPMGAMIFVGKKGAGKSSLAAAFEAAGFPFLSDDLAVIDFSQNPAVVLSGFPHVKLWPDSAELLYGGKGLARLRDEVEKFGRILRPVPPMAVPLYRVFLLDEGQELLLEPEPPQKALVELMAHWYGARFGRELFEALGAQQHLQQCAMLVKQAEVFRFYRPNNLQLLPSHVEFLSSSETLASH